MRSNRFAVLKNARVGVFEDILKNGRNDLISVSLKFVVRDTMNSNYLI